ncbi:CRISPR-associated endonuclease Cas3'' [Methylococcus geothermalis]|uniref:CRISPR-associated endonuclease Cas3 n=1 Tax=Methylococcus geothermalis TaxID=2681310 RepID=A0A858Q6N6_9GAMM|nr:CRISPR-associated endonuclease Cas3'' [Methylococcus geothermalis]QJD29552.1 CRISPR-associated endonuclease Cas3'' [Methylococcus geothermalis]
MASLMVQEKLETTYLAHTENASGVPHLLREHLYFVGKLARHFSEKACPALNESADWAGRLHDLGKYRDEFQSYLRNQRDSSTETHHAVYGAAAAFQRESNGPAFAIAGHHAGLHDRDALQELLLGSKYQAETRVPPLLTRFERELGKLPERIADPDFIQTSPYSVEFYIRMLFSLLIDADRLDTEAHANGFCRLAPKLDAAGLLQRLMDEKNAKSSEGELNALRHRIFQACLDRANEAPGFFSLTVPTGGGKTLSGMAFALAHAAHHQLRRVIVVIPYLSIIEQNAAQYRRILDPDDEGIVVEHHSAIPVPEDVDESRPLSPFEKHPAEYAVENWDAPVIVTTSVQFIETLFASRTSRCRKLHNIARSVVIFDEVQTLPSHLLNPLLNVFRELRQHYGTSFVFSTATQPAFRRRPLSLTEGFSPDEIKPILDDDVAKAVFRRLNRVAFKPFPRPDETLAWETLAESMAECDQVLCVVNVRRHAFELWEKLRNSVGDKDSVFHLSSAMCAEHRLAILGEDRDPAPGTIRWRLRNRQPCRLVSTQLIEAGVDVDFPAVWRALAPMDSIVQTAGRCNRENLLTDENGNAIPGKVIVFRPETHSLPAGIYKTATGLTATLLDGMDMEKLTTDPALFDRYFDQLYQLVPTDRKIQEEREKLHFRKVAGLARVIEDDTQAAVVPYGKAIDIVRTIRERPVEPGKPRISRDDLRALQRYMVNLHTRDHQRLLSLKAIRPLLPNLDIPVLEEGWYHDHLGVLIDQRPTEDFLL